MKPGFLLNYYQKKNKNSLEKLMKKIPTDLSNIINDYKYKLDHYEKITKLNKQFKENKYWCTCCDTDKFQTICPISNICECCKEPRCNDCVDCHHFDEESKLCNNCFLSFSIFTYVENLIGRKLTHVEMDEINIITEELTNIDDLEELINVLDVLEEYHINIPETEENPIRYFTIEQMKIELNSIVNSIVFVQDDEEDFFIEIENESETESDENEEDLIVRINV